jgi:hypothetical protein
MAAHSLVFVVISGALGMLGGGCGGAIAEQPLTIPLGIDRAAADTALEQHQYCHHVDGPRPKIETYQRCKRVGTEWGESWVQATYDDAGKLVELRRYERFTDEERATERWNQLVADRARTGQPADQTALGDRPLEPGTRTVKLFRVGGDTVVGVYLLEPEPPRDANILEAVFRNDAKK